MSLFVPKARGRKVCSELPRVDWTAIGSGCIALQNPATGVKVWRSSPGAPQLDRLLFGLTGASFERVGSARQLRALFQNPWGDERGAHVIPFLFALAIDDDPILELVIDRCTARCTDVA